MAPRALGLSLLVVLLGVAGPARAEPATWSASTDDGRIMVHVSKRGFLSGLAHDHHFSATGVAGDRDPRSRRAGPGPRRGRRGGRLAAGPAGGPLRAGTDQGRRARGRTRRRSTAARYPEIRFVADRLAGDGPAPARAEDGLSGDLVGTLSLHGVSRPLRVPVHATREEARWRVQGAARLKQSDFGIEPYSGFGGAVAVHDEVVIEFDLLLSPAPPPAPPP